MRFFLPLISLIVPFEARARWREEWLAELQHGGWRRFAGALPDAWAMRRAAKQDLPAEAGSHKGTRAGLSSPFHAIDQDVRYAVRGFSSGKSFTLAVVGSLAIGIAATTSGFVLLNATFFRPFVGIQDEHELVRVKIGNGRIWTTTTWNEYEQVKTSLTMLQGVAASYSAGLAVSVDGSAAERASAAVVSFNYFDVLGATPAVGRFFLPDEDATPWAEPAVVVSHQFWQRQLSGDPTVTQRTLIVNGRILSIVGVAPEGFTNLGDPVAVWTTFATSELAFRDKDGRPIHVRHAGPVMLDMVGRLKPGGTIEAAVGQAAAVGAPIVAARGGRVSKEMMLRVEPIRRDDPETLAARSASLMGVPLIVLAIACINAANLLLARASRRSTDWLVRLALGASRWRLIRQLLVESLLLAFGGAAAGLVVCYWMIGARQPFGTADSPLSLLLDGHVLLFTLAAAAATALVFGLGPAVSVTRAAHSRAPAGGRFMRGPFGSRTRSALVVLQAALCLALLATGGQFTNTLRGMLADDNMKDPDTLISAIIDLDQTPLTAEQTQSFRDEVLRRVQQLPAVEAAAITNESYFSGGVGPEVGARVWLMGESSDARRSEIAYYAGGDFFQTVRLPLLRGRTFSSAELAGASPAVVVNQAFAEKLDGDPLGHTIRIAAPTGDYPAAVDTPIVGVVPSPVYSRGHTQSFLYLPLPLSRQPALNLLVRFTADSAATIATVNRVIGSVDTRVPVTWIETGTQMRQRRNEPDIQLAREVSLRGLLALILACAGLYGVVSYMVTLRHKEIGIRMALGAEAPSVLRLILRQSIAPVLVGCALGAVGAVVASYIIRSELYGLSPVDPAAFAGSTLLLLTSMTAASLVPARRASRVDPVEVLRQE